MSEMLTDVGYLSPLDSHIKASN